jgi:hypothetical protein
MKTKQLQIELLNQMACQTIECASSWYETGAECYNSDPNDPYASECAEQSDMLFERAHFIFDAADTLEEPDTDGGNWQDEAEFFQESLNEQE